MNKFKTTPHGSLWVESTESLDETMYALKLYIRSSAAATSFKYDPKATTTLMKLCRDLTGYDFKAFLIQNFNNGLARRAELVMSILQYLQGGVTNRAVATQLSIGENQFLQGVSKDMNFTHTIPVGMHARLPAGIEDVTNKDFYRLIECLGPVKVARLFLMLAGDTHNAIRQ